VRFPFPGDRSVLVITVVDSKLLAVDENLLVDEDQYRLLRGTEKSLLEESERLLATESARLKAAGWSCSSEIRRGDPAEEIARSAEALQPDMIVLGAHGYKGVRHLLLGSVSDRILRHSHCSVLIVRPSPALSAPVAAGQPVPWRILVAYDDSRPATAALDLCASLPLAENTDISVVGIMPMIHGYRQDIRQQLDDIWRQQKDARQKTLEAAVTTRQWSTTHVTAKLLESTDVSHEIVNLAREQASDVVVIGDKGRSALQRFLLGSITGYVTGHAPCSVMVVKTG
jgi:nucleotide-binding universal stress UspA family protein